MRRGIRFVALYLFTLEKWVYGRTGQDMTVTALVMFGGIFVMVVVWALMIERGGSMVVWSVVVLAATYAQSMVVTEMNNIYWEQKDPRLDVNNPTSRHDPS